MKLGLGLSLSNIAAQGVSLPRRIAAILRKFGDGAHVFMAGVGRIDGFTTGNYLESTGQTHAVVDGAVGLVLDAAGSVGAELIVNGDFSNGTAGWTVQGSTISVVSGKLSVGTTSGAGGAWQDVPTVAGKTYEVVAGFDSAIAASLKVYVGGAFTTTLYNGTDSATIRQERAVFQATSSTSRVYLRNGGVATCLYDNISVRELPGTHATQAATANKPTLRQTNGKYAWQFDGVDDRLVLGSVPFGMADDHVVVASGRCNSATWRQVIFAIRAASVANPIVCEVAFNSGYPQARWRNDAGTALSLQSTTAIVGQNCVIRAVAQGGTGYLYVNGVLVGSALLPGGAATVNMATIGGASNGVGGYGDFLDGSLVELTPIKGQLSAADAKSIEKYHGSLAGVQIP